MTPRIITRPSRRTHGTADPATVDAILKTATSGYAVIVPCQLGESLYLVYNRYRNAVKARGYRFHGQTGSRGELIAWAERGIA